MDRKPNRQCGPCETEGETVKDVVRFCVDCDQHLCAECWKYHKRIKQLNSHECVGIDEENRVDTERVEKTPSFIGTSEAVHVKSEANKEHCPRHDRKLNDHYCTACNEMGCRECMSTCHQQCRPVHFPDIHTYLSQSTPFDSDDFDFRKLREGFAEIRGSIYSVKMNMEQLQENLKEKGVSISDQLSNIQGAVKELTDLFVKSMGTASDDIREDEKDIYNKITNKLRELEKLREATISSNDSMQTLRVLNAISSVDRMIQGLTECKRVQHIRTPLYLMKQLQAFVENIHIFKTKLTRSSFDYSCLTDMNLTDDKESKPCQISGAIMTASRLIVADCNNKKVKVFDTEKEKQIAEIKLPSLFSDQE